MRRARNEAAAAGCRVGSGRRKILNSGIIIFWFRWAMRWRTILPGGLVLQSAQVHLIVCFVCASLAASLWWLCWWWWLEHQQRQEAATTHY